MTFLTPLFLIAALAGIIPVVLHMISRRKAKELPYSTLRFLRVSVQKTRRRQRVHDVLLMLVRIAALVLIALGLARPTLTSLESLWGGGAGAAVAIILDNSASMGVIDQEHVRFETARAAATQILDELEEGDRVALLLTGGPVFPEQGRLDRTHEKVRQMLAACTVSYERADLAVKVQQARKLLDRSKAVNKQIYVLTDMQKLSWESMKAEAMQPELSPRAATRGPEDIDDALDIPIIFVDCNRAPKPNVAVQRVELKAPVPVTGVPVVATVEVFGAAPIAQQRHLELVVDGAKRASSPVLDIPPGGLVKYNFQFAFHRGGLHRGEVRLLGEDGSKLDDCRFFTVEIDRGIPVAIIKARAHEIRYLEDTFYIEQALAPGGSAIRGTALTLSQLAGESLSPYKVIFCVNLPAPDAEVADRLAAYVAGGGSLVWICGDNVEPDEYNEMNRRVGDRLLPAPLAEVRTAGTAGMAEQRDSWNVTFLDKRHPALAGMAEPASLYQSVLVYKHVRMDTGAAADAWVLARLDDGEALLVQRTVEKGSVLMLGTGGHVGWTNLPLRPIFLPLLVRLVFDLAGAEQSRRETLAGSPLILPPADNARPTGVEVQAPSGETIRLSLDEQQGPGETFRYADTHRIGVYVLRWLGASRGDRVAFSVNVDPDEADPTKIQREELQSRFGWTPLVFADNPDDLSGTFALLREGESLWELFLACVLIALVFETFLSNRIGSRREKEHNGSN